MTKTFNKKIKEKDVSYEFFDKWYKADDLTKIKLIRRLNTPKELATLVNSYFEDLVDYIEKRLSKSLKWMVLRSDENER